MSASSMVFSKTGPVATSLARITSPTDSFIHS